MATQANVTDQSQQGSGIHQVPPPQPIVRQRMSLYDLTLEGMQIEDALIASDGELTPELEARFDAMLQKGPESIDAAAGVVKELLASAEASKAEKNRQQAREKSFELNAKNLKNRIRVAVDAVFSGKLKTRRFNLFTSKGRVSNEVKLLTEMDTQEALKHLYAARPDLVKEVVTTTYVLDVDAVLTIYNAEAPDRAAFNDSMSAWRELVQLAGEDEALKKAALDREPIAPQSNIPAVVEVEVTYGDRSLTIK